MRATSLLSTKALKSKAALATPTKVSKEGGGVVVGGDGAPAATPAPAQPDRDDPIKVIQALIYESHMKLTQEVETLLVNYENQLRTDIKSVLRRHATGIDARPTPLDERASCAPVAATPAR